MKNKKLITFVLLCICAISSTSIFAFINLDNGAHHHHNENLEKDEKNDTIINNGPIINELFPLNNPIINETYLQEFRVNAFDPDGDLLVYSWFLNDSKINTNRNNYIYQSDYNSQGFYHVKVVINDSIDTVEYNWDLTVYNLNRAPEIIKKVPESNFYSFKESDTQDFIIETHDLDDDNLTIYWYLNESLTQIGGNYTFNPDFDFEGDYKLKVNITDGHLKDEFTWLISVIDVNRPPEIIPITPISITPNINEAEFQEFIVNIIDPDLDPVSIGWYINGSLVQNGGNFTFIADYEIAGFYEILVSASDGTLKSNFTWILKVNNSNRPPMIIKIDPIGYNLIINETENQKFSIEINDPDFDPISISWFVDGLSVKNGGNLTYFSNYDSAGIHYITVSITDGDFIDEYEWVLQVLNVNRPPQLIKVSPTRIFQEINENEKIQFEIEVFDPDLEPLSITWYIDDSIVQTQENFTFIADYEMAGFYEILVKINDGDLIVEYNWLVTVNDVNRAPQITYLNPSTLNPIISDNGYQDFIIRIADPDTDSLTLSWYVDGLLVQNGGNFSFYTDKYSVGVYKVKVNISDGDLIVDHIWTLSVLTLEDLIDLEYTIGELDDFYDYNDLNQYFPEQELISFYENNGLEIHNKFLSEFQFTTFISMDFNFKIPLPGGKNISCTTTFEWIGDDLKITQKFAFTLPCVVYGLDLTISGKFIFYLLDDGTLTEPEFIADVDLNKSVSYSIYDTPLSFSFGISVIGLEFTSSDFSQFILHTKATASADLGVLRFNLFIDLGIILDLFEGYKGYIYDYGFIVSRLGFEEIINGIKDFFDDQIQNICEVLGVDALENYFTTAELVKKGVSAAVFKAAGYTAYFLKEYYELNEIVAAGFTAGVLKAAGYTADVLKDYYELNEMVAAGFTAGVLKAAGYTADVLKAYYELNEMVAAGFAAGVLKVAGYLISELKDYFQPNEILSCFGYNEMLSFFGQSQMLSWFGENQMLSWFGENQMLSWFGENQMLSWFGENQMLSWFGKDQMLSWFGKDQMLSLFGKDQMLSLFGKDQMLSLFGKNQMLSLFGKNQMLSLFGKNQMLSWFGKNQMLSWFGKDQMLSWFGKDQMLSLFGKNQMLSLFGKNQMLSLFGKNQMLSLFGPDQMLSWFGPYQMVSWFSSSQLISWFGDWITNFF